MGQFLIWRAHLNFGPYRNLAHMLAHRSEKVVGPLVKRPYLFLHPCTEFFWSNFSIAERRRQPSHLSKNVWIGLFWHFSSFTHHCQNSQYNPPFPGHQIGGVALFFSKTDLVADCGMSITSWDGVRFKDFDATDQWNAGFTGKYVEFTNILSRIIFDWEISPWSILCTSTYIRIY